MSYASLSTRNGGPNGQYITLDQYMGVALFWVNVGAIDQYQMHQLVRHAKGLDDLQNTGIAGHV